MGAHALGKGGPKRTATAPSAETRVGRTKVLDLGHQRTHFPAQHSATYMRRIAQQQA